MALFLLPCCELGKCCDFFLTIKINLAVIKNVGFKKKQGNHNCGAELGQRRVAGTLLGMGDGPESAAAALRAWALGKVGTSRGRAVTRAQVSRRETQALCPLKRNFFSRFLLFQVA